MALVLTPMDVRQTCCWNIVAFAPVSLLCKAFSEPQKGQGSGSPLSFQTGLYDYFLLPVNTQ